jgi:transcriptional regulator with XRE-family HTH domain
MKVAPFKERGSRSARGWTGTLWRFYQASRQAKSAIYPGGRALGGADTTTQMAQRKIHIMAVSTSELGATLRDWRERLDPGDFGVAVSSGRKAHGLRRQEVAQLSGVSVDYLIQLEQGRAKTPSPQVLTALSQALRLSNVERIHLFFLAGQSPQDSARRHQAVPDSLRRMVRQLPGNPAAIYDPSWSPIIWNSMWATIFGDPNERPERERNKVWRYFTGLPTRVLRSPEEERLFEKRIISDLRSSFGQYPDDEQLGQLISDLLAASPRFCELWKAREVAPYDEEHKTIEHPELGLLQLHCDIVRHEGLRVVVFTAPAGSTSAKALIAAQRLPLDQHPLSASEAGRPAHRAE